MSSIITIAADAVESITGAGSAYARTISIDLEMDTGQMLEAMGAMVDELSGREKRQFFDDCFADMIAAEREEAADEARQQAESERGDA